MHMRFSFLSVAVALALSFVSLPVSHADTIQVAVSTSATPPASGTTTTSGVPVTFSFGANLSGAVVVSGTPPLGEPNLNSVTLNLSTSPTSTAGTFYVWVTETGLTTSVPGFLSTLETQALTNGWTITENTYVDTTNTAFGVGTPLSSHSFSKAGVFSNGVALPTSGTYSVTEEFIITTTGGLASSTDSIDLAAIPEPTSMSLLGTGLLGLGAILRKKLV